MCTGAAAVSSTPPASADGAGPCPGSNSRARAEAAVADADVVVLCFDTQSQQAGEFSKIAQWVSRYGKPVVAVLNSRNARWRNPTKVARQSTRRDLSRTVHEHVGNIRDELGLVGLPDVPVVAIHTKRAAFARTSDPYAGPDADSRQKQRDEYGPERLLAWSNLPAFESLLTEALARHAAPLRLGMLHEQARGLLTDTEAAVRTEHDEAAALAEQLERGIADVLGLVGRPANKDLAKGIKRLEKLRGGFGTTGASELLRHARHRLAAGLRSARTGGVPQRRPPSRSGVRSKEDLDAGGVRPRGPHPGPDGSRSGGPHRRRANCSNTCRSDSNWWPTMCGPT